jgi:hypothetical protein
MFDNGKYSVTYGTNKEALFTIVDEEYKGSNHLGRINKLTILVREYNADGSVGKATLQSSVIGMGNAIVGVKTALPELRGKILNHDNMAQCTVILYE